MNSCYFEPADIGFSRGQLPLHWFIRFGSRTAFEDPSLVNHTFGISQAGGVREALIIESMHRIQEVNLWDTYAPTDREIEVWRPLNLNEQEKQGIVSHARNFVGQRYPYKDLMLHLLDRLFLNTYFFRKFQSTTSRICSRLWAEAYAQYNLNFGGDPTEINPDDQQDFCRATEGKYYEKVFELSSLSE